MTDIEPLLRRLGMPLRAMILNAYHGRDTCIPSVRLAIDVLESIGTQVEPLAVECRIFNRPFVERVKQEKRLPDGKEELDRWYAECGAHSIGIGHRQSDEQPGLHVVAIVQRKWLWDLSIDQASRPEKGITLERPILAPANETFLAGRNYVQGVIPDGPLLMYKARPGYEPWLKSRNWNPTGEDADAREALTNVALAGLATYLTRVAIAGDQHAAGQSR